MIGKEIHQVARVYSLYDVAEILLAERGRSLAADDCPPLFLRHEKTANASAARTDL